MSYLVGLLDHRCSIERRAAGSNELGEPDGAWSTVASNLSCHRVVKRERRWKVDDVENLSVLVESLLIPAGTDVLKGDRINALDLGAGESLGPFLVDQILDRRRPNLGSHHITLFLREFA